VHKPRGGALAHKAMQRRADEAAFRNAGEVVEAARKAAAVFQPHVVVLAGEVQGRTAVREQLTDELARLVVESGQGGGDRHAVEENLAEELARIAGEEQARRAQRQSEVFGDNLSSRLATQGNERLAQAAELGAVDTLLFEEGEPASREAFLIKACAETDADCELLPAGSGLADGVGALLRFQLPE
jgi:stalled ribosome rescue protein Dom34